MSEGARFAVGCDHAAVALKRILIEALRSRDVVVEDLGTHSDASVDYPDFAHAVCAKILADEADFGLLICGSGVGMSIAANRHVGIRAVVCSEPYSAEMARAHNDANVLCLGARVVGTGLAERIVEAFVSGTYEGGRHAARVAKIETPAD